MRSLLYALVILAGCSDLTPFVDPMEEVDPAGDAPATSERFVGEWMIDQPYHAGYEATWYRFEADTALLRTRVCAVGSPYTPTGYVVSADTTRRCDFADRWSSLDDQTLVVQATCTDGASAEIVLAFSEDASTNAQGLTTVAVVSVGDETDWGHFFPEWRWVKCVGTGNACTPQIDCPIGP